MAEAEPCAAHVSYAGSSCSPQGPSGELSTPGREVAGCQPGPSQHMLPAAKDAAMQDWGLGTCPPLPASEMVQVSILFHRVWCVCED